MQREYLTIRQVQVDMKQSEGKAELPHRPSKQILIFNLITWSLLIFYPSFFGNLDQNSFLILYWSMKVIGFHSILQARNPTTFLAWIGIILELHLIHSFLQCLRICLNYRSFNEIKSSIVWSFGSPFDLKNFFSQPSYVTLVANIPFNLLEQDIQLWFSHCFAWYFV